MDRLNENLYMMQKSIERKTHHEWLERVVEKSAVEDTHFRVCHFDFGRMMCGGRWKIKLLGVV